VGAAHACVRHARGTFSCWGERYYGQLGTGGGKDKADVPAPGHAVTLPAPALQIAAGAGHTCVLVAGGRIYCFGLNSAGQIGAGPDQILAARVRTGLHGRPIAIGSGPAARHTCAVLVDGRVDCWGNDDAGQLGDAPRTLQEGRYARDPVAVAF
jgi:alpha-tubulin suppressor-like RCC1 family protein